MKVGALFIMLLKKAMMKWWSSSFENSMPMSISNHIMEELHYMLLAIGRIRKWLRGSYLLERIQTLLKYQMEILQFILWRSLLRIQNWSSFSFHSARKVFSNKINKGNYLISSLKTRISRICFNLLSRAECPQRKNRKREKVMDSIKYTLMIAKSKMSRQCLIGWMFMYL